MSEPDRPDDNHGHRLAESLRRAAEIAEGHDRDDVRAAPSLLPREERGFREGVEAHVAYRKRMTPEMGEMWELGEYDPHARPDDGGSFVHLDGEAPRPIRFPPWFRAWFAKQSQRTLRLLDKLIAWLDEHGEDEATKRLADLDEMIERHRRRRKLVARAIWAAKYGGPAAGTTFGIVVGLSDKIGRIIEQLPLIRALWKAIMGPT